ncbi:MAG TPA: hypothetical protein VJ972_00470 [Anaerolineales bacterium]|nr:hypothetical protein [Anaerolineales bacterium]
MKRSVNSVVFLIVFFITIFLASCSQPAQLPTDARGALENYWQSLPSDPNLTHQIIQAWPGDVPEETTTSKTPNIEVWCVEAEITTATDASIIGETVTWIMFRNDEKADWDVAMLATMSSIWPYEACGKGLY